MSFSLAWSDSWPLHLEPKNNRGIKIIVIINNSSSNSNYTGIG